MSRRRNTERYWVHSDPEPPTVATAALTITGPCPGRCNAAWRREQSDLPPTMGEPVWCGRCQTEIVTAIGRLPDLAASAGARRDGRLNLPADVSQERSTPGADTPSASPAWDATDEAIMWAGDLRRALAYQLHHIDVPNDQSGRPVYNLVNDTRYLMTWARPLLSGTFALDAGRDALSLASRLTRASGRDELIHRLDAPCPSCDRIGLQRADGSDTVSCRYCRNRWPEADYRRLTVILAEEYRRAQRP